MANELDEMEGLVNEAGRDVNVIEKQLPVTVGWGATLFEILQNVAGLVAKAIDLDKDVMKAVAAFRGGKLPEGTRNEVANQIDGCFGRLFPQVEAYPELKAHAAIADAMQ